MTGPPQDAQRRRTRSLALVLLALVLGALTATPSFATASATALSASAVAAHCEATASNDCSQQLTSADHVAVVAVRQVRRDAAPRPLPVVAREPSTLPSNQGWYAHATHPRPPTAAQHDAAPSLSRRGPPAQAEP